MALAGPILQGLGFGPGRVATIETDDPFALGDTLRAMPAMAPAPRPASFAAGGRQARGDAACRCANCIAPRRRRSTSSPLPAGAPFGTLEVQTSKAARCACPACRPARPARSATMPNGRC